MDNTDARKLVNEVFNRILQAHSADDLSNFVSEHSLLQANRLDRGVYPELRLSLTRAEVEKLISEGSLTTEGRLAADISGKTLSPLEKLLYAVVWKNRDLPKIAHIVEGVKDANTNAVRSNGHSQVFYQFGRYLADRGESIIDQHVLRSFLLWRTEHDDKKMNAIRRLTSLNYRAQAIGEYKKWLKTAQFLPGLRESQDYLVHIDSTLFALGKTIKLDKETK